MTIRCLLSSGLTPFSLLLAGLMTLALGGCDDGRSTWDDLAEHEGIEEPRGAGGLARSVTEATTREPSGPPALDTIEVSELTAHGLEASRARVLVETINPVLDSARSLPGYEAWWPTVEGEGRPGLYFGTPAVLRAVARLSPDDVVAWSGLQTEMLLAFLDGDGADRCGQWAAGQRDVAMTVDAYNALPPKRLRELADLQVRALLAELAAEEPLPPATAEELNDVMRGVVDVMRSTLRQDPHPDLEEAARRFVTVAQNDDRTAPDQCFMYFTIWEYLQHLSDGQRRAFLRGYYR
jgi:hypothetical protein